MNTPSQIREELHAYIDAADDQRLESILAFVQEKRTYPKEFLEELYRREQQLLSGEMESFTVAESHDWIRAQYAKKNGI